MYIAITIALGLISRMGFLPSFLYAYLGDALYALMFFFMVGFVFFKQSTLSVMLLALLFCYVIEFSQLYQADWINAIRQTRLGGLVLGFGFLWSDLVSYALGVSLGAVLEKYVLVKTK